MKQSKQSKQPGNVYTIIGGKVYGTFHPGFRAEKEKAAAAAGMTFDQFMIHEDRQMFLQMLAATY